MNKPLSDDDVRMAESIFRLYLRDRKLKFTPERKIMLVEVLANDGHFEAEQLLTSILQAGKRVGKATIYRTLPLLVDCGILRQVHLDDKLMRYECTFGQSPHDHMVCSVCGKVVEFDSADVVNLRAIIAARHKFHARSHRLRITGLCWGCAEARLQGERPFVSGDGSAGD